MAGTHASMMLRLYRKDSIKLMLAWETCCRFSPILAPHHPSSPKCDHADNSSLRCIRPGIWCTLHISSNRDYCWCAGPCGLCTFVCLTHTDLRLARTDHTTQMSRRICFD